ncbi:MAG TPA: thiamine phosphate synthase [Rhizomicrobium sp.]
MADNLARAQLARAARRLHSAAGSKLPPLILLTDDDRLPDPISAVLALPRGSLVVLRSRDKGRLVALAVLLERIAHGRGLKWVIADDAPLAARSGAHGAHFPEQQIALAADWRVRRPQWLITCAGHSLRACLRAAIAGVDAILLGPAFPTASHPGRLHIGSLRMRHIASAVLVPVYALGGVDEQSARRLAGSRLAGLAAVNALGPG